MQIHRSRSVQRSHHACRLRERIHLPPRDVHTADRGDHVHENILATEAKIVVISKEVDLPVRAPFRPSHLLDLNAPPAQGRHVCPFRLQRDLEVTDARVLHGDEPIVLAAQLEANVKLADDRPHHVQPPPSYIPRHDQILYTSRVEPDLERLLVHEPVARHEIS